ncbi:MAG: PIN domain-containing protein [Spirochaetaceae bacterium]|nr:PIN domain-containing protein [Spirochaetaceae bacterium]
MRVIVDTCVWSLAFRKKEKTLFEQNLINYLAEQIRDLRIVMIGPIRQEILSGIPSESKFTDMRNKLSVFSDWTIKSEDYELAAKFYNKCRRYGIQGSHIDYLICAVAFNNGFSILTLDNDFDNYQNYTGIILEKKEFD